jgi:uncharacterized protein (UPF0332 family)
MEIKELNELLKNKDKLEEKIQNYMKWQTLVKEKINKEDIIGHLSKAKNNLTFVDNNIPLGHIDWAIAGCYYAVYHATLALILGKGYSSKNHDATLCMAIREYYGEGIFDEDITLINFFFLTYQDLLFYIDAREKRKDASYSPRFLFSKEEVEELRQKAMAYIVKVELILKENLAKEKK